MTQLWSNKGTTNVNVAPWIIIIVIILHTLSLRTITTHAWNQFACVGMQDDTQHQDQQGSVAPGQKANVLEALETHMNAVTVQTWKLNTKSTRLGLVACMHARNICMHTPLILSHCIVHTLGPDASSVCAASALCSFLPAMSYEHANWGIRRACETCHVSPSWHSSLTATDSAVSAGASVCALLPVMSAGSRWGRA